MPNLIIGIFLVLFIVEFVLEFILNELNIRQVQKSRAAQAVPEFFQEKIS
ncbi:MAG: hypothetical protein K0Q83_562, partial [Deltaproteobacteria bacterium]|nr:hypothetical protein [Deltaproteobacteria bacterium]